MPPKFIHEFKTYDGLKASIDLSRVVYFEEIAKTGIVNFTLVRIVFENNIDILVTDSYDEIVKITNL